jgi:hypothetical protein
MLCEGWSADELHADTDARIRRHGFTMSGVRGGDGVPTWIYTVGLADHEHPELVIANVVVDRAYDVLTDLATRVLDGDRLEEARRVAYLGGAEPPRAPGLRTPTTRPRAVIRGRLRACLQLADLGEDHGIDLPVPRRREPDRRPGSGRGAPV